MEEGIGQPISHRYSRYEEKRTSDRTSTDPHKFRLAWPSSLVSLKKYLHKITSLLHHGYMREEVAKYVNDFDNVMLEHQSTCSDASSIIAHLGLREEADRTEDELSIDDLVRSLHLTAGLRQISIIHDLIERQTLVPKDVCRYLEVEFTRIALLEEDQQKQIVAIQAIGVYGRYKSISALKICLHHADKFIRMAAVLAIVEIGMRVDLEQSFMYAANALTIASYDKHEIVRAASIQAMGKFAENRIAKLTFTNAVTAALDDDEEAVRAVAVRAFYRLQGPQSEPRLRIIAQRDQDIRVRYEAQMLLVAMGDQAAFQNVLLSRATMQQMQEDNFPFPEDGEASMQNTTVDPSLTRLSPPQAPSEQRALMIAGQETQECRQCHLPSFSSRGPQGTKRDQQQKSFSLRNTSLSVLCLVFMCIIMVVHGFITRPTWAISVAPQPKIEHQGQTISTKIQIKNDNSTQVWSAKDGYYFVCVPLDAHACMEQIVIKIDDDTVAYDHTYTTSISLQALSLSGSYTLKWVLKKGTTIILGAYMVINIIVVP